MLVISLVPQSFADKVAVLDTKFGKMVIEFFPKDAPKTVDNFIKLTQSGIYNGTKFHRIIKDFMIQGGDPLSRDSRLVQQWGTGDAGYTIPAEFNNIKHKRGIVSMARHPGDPNSASSQFFIMQKDSPSLDGKYTVFGRLITNQSYTVLDAIASLETVHELHSNVPLDIPLNYGDAEVSGVTIKDRSEIPDVLQLGEPERFVSHSKMDENGNYINTLLDFSFHVPPGWFVQEPEKTQPEAPDVVVVSSQVDGFTPVVSFLVENTNGTSLEDHIKKTRTNLQILVDAGRLQILSEEDKKINGYDSHVTDAKGGFITKDKVFLVKYKEIIIKSDDKFYTLTYTNQEKHFEENLADFNEILNSLKISKPKGTLPIPQFPPEVGIGIAIATAIAVIVLVVKRKRSVSKPKEKGSKTKK